MAPMLGCDVIPDIESTAASAANSVACIFPKRPLSHHCYLPTAVPLKTTNLPIMATCQQRSPQNDQSSHYGYLPTAVPHKTTDHPITAR
jgi:hypothetical protein